MIRGWSFSGVAAAAAAAALWVGAAAVSGCVSRGDSEVDTRLADGGASADGAASTAATCTAFCNNVAKNKCTFDSDCRGTCENLAGAGFCKREWSAWVACASKAPMTCSSDGFPSPGGCADEEKAVVSCAEVQKDMDLCSGTTGADCGTCCGTLIVNEQQELAGDVFYGHAYDCICQACKAECGEYCSTGLLGGDQGVKCEACIWTKAKTAGCLAKALDGCATDPKCDRFLSCYNTVCGGK